MATAETTEKLIENIAEELEVKLPKELLPLPIRIGTLIMIIGGLSILGSVFTDFALPSSSGFGLHLYRMITGVAFLAVAYGLHSRRRWSVWLYGFIVAIGLFINPTLTLIPSLLIVYLYTQRKVLKPSALDKYLGRLSVKVEGFFKKVK
ncbi:MAG: hypothetical protein K9M11_00425 [Candidatus Pacebacteria bacterium]|nr:hypothetical protein [Candidatus Paceibacterota bacterium]